jgi:hypothetical protein
MKEHCFSSKSYAAGEAFSNTYPEKDVPNKSTIYQVVTTLQHYWTEEVFEKGSMFGFGQR